MAISFGADLADVTASPDELRQLLEEPGGPDPVEEQLLDADPDPGWGEPSMGERIMDAAKGSRVPPPRVSPRVRKDVQAKVALMAGMLAGTWRMRDPFCGEAAMAQVPEFSEALADILCDSPDLVAWFTATGGFMKWMKLAMAVQPVAMMAFRHHVVHTVGQEDEDEGQPGPQWGPGYGA